MISYQVPYLFTIVCYIQKSGVVIQKKNRLVKAKVYFARCYRTNMDMLWCFYMILCMQWEIPGWVCLLCRHNGIDTERERAGGGCHSPGSALIIKICCTMVSFVQQSFNFVLVHLINGPAGVSFDFTIYI